MSSKKEKRAPILFDEILDWRGTPMRVGSCVVFPVSFGRGSMMKEGVVISIEQATDWEGKPQTEVVKWHYDETKDRGHQHVVDETRPVYKIGVQTIKYEGGDRWNNGNRWWEHNNFTDRPSYPHPDRITVVQPRERADSTSPTSAT